MDLTMDWKPKYGPNIDEKLPILDYKDPNTLQFIILSTITDISRFYTVIFKNFIEFPVDFW
jgi:hypothetical protein